MVIHVIYKMYYMVIHVNNPYYMDISLVFFPPRNQWEVLLLKKLVTFGPTLCPYTTHHHRGLRLGVTPEEVSMLRRSFRSERLLLVRRTGAKVVVKQSGPGTSYFSSVKKTPFISGWKKNIRQISIYLSAKGAHFGLGFCYQWKLHKGLGRDNIQMTTLTQTQEVHVFFCCVCVCVCFFGRFESTNDD